MTLVEAPAALPLPAPSPVAVARAAEPTLYGVRPGMTVPEVRARLGVEGTTRSRAEAEQWWNGAGYDPQKELPFVLGFDEQLTFNQDQPDREKPVWDVYFQKGRAVLFKVAVYDEATDVELTTHFGFPPTCFVGADASEVRATLGEPDLTRDVAGAGDRQSHYYLRRGIAVMTEKGRVGVFDLFTPLEGARLLEIAGALR